MTNREILRAETESLGELDQQRQLLLRLALKPMPCPACGRGLSHPQAAGVDLDEYDPDATDHRCACPCGAELEQVVPFFPDGRHGWHWKLKDEWLRAQLEKARAYDRLPRGEET